MPFTYEYARPAVTVDMVIVVPCEQSHEILLIERGDDPFQGMWALPGGFMEIDEELDDAAARELEEETGLKNIAMRQIGAWGKVGRDPRGRTVSVVYMALLEEKPQTRAGDDAADAVWFPIDKLPELAFDHGDIVEHAKTLLS